MTIDVISPETVYFHVTKECNLCCTHCYSSAGRPLADELTRIEIASVWRALVAVMPNKVVLTGGEPLMRPDIYGLLQDLLGTDRHHRIRRCLNTNGWLLTPEVAAGLVGLADEVRVSIDALERRNDDCRGRGSFDRALRAADACRRAGLSVSMLVTVTRHSLPDLEELLCLLISEGYAKININRFRPVGRGRGQLEWCVSSEEIESTVTRAWRRLHSSSQPSVTGDERSSQSTCGVGRVLNIVPNGEVYPCHVLTGSEWKCGNVRKAGFESICSRLGLLGRLRALDFHDLARVDPSLSELTVKGACLGEVYARRRDSPVWREAIGW